MQSDDIKATIPNDIRNRILPEERVLYYIQGGGCLKGPRSYFIITDSRVMLSELKKGGCLGMGGSTTALDIPLEHISSVGTEKSGCISKVGIVEVSSGTASSSVMLNNPKEAENASLELQKLLRERRKGS